MNQHPVYRFDDFLVDPDNWTLTRDGEEVHLEPVVLKLLIYLISHRDRLVTRQELMDTVWGDTVISESALTKAVARLRKALQDDSSHPSYLETVHSQGFRFIATVEETVKPISSANSGRSAMLRTGLVGATTVIIALMLFNFWPGTSGDDGPETAAIRSVAVLPLRNLTGDPGQDYFVDGLQDILITELSQIPGLRVTSRQSTRRYRASELALTDIAAELGVDALVEGSLLRAGGEVTLTIQLVDGRSDEHHWAQRYERETARLFDLAADIARAIGSAIDLASPPRLPGDSIDRVDPRAIDAYSLGLMHLDRFTPSDLSIAVEQLQQATAIEPRFALAWGQLAAAYVVQSMYGFTPPREAIEMARAAALKALAADPEFYIGHSTLGWVRLWTGDFERACESFAEALRLNPSAPYALHGDADCLMHQGRWDDSIERMRELMVVSPYSSMPSRALGYHLFLARRYDEAIDAVAAMRATDDGLLLHYLLAWIYWDQGQYDKALAEERWELERRGDAVLLAALDEGLDSDGPLGAMRAMAEALVERSTERYVDPFEIGKTFARAGMVDEALHWLNAAVDYGSFEIFYLALRPDFDVLRDDPRFNELLVRVYGEQVPQQNL
jgi:TolB-like protein/DNA-binding winged helix-turn-helix (wHTH) protein